MHKTSVVIVNYNVRELILKCLETLYQFHPEEDLEVIVVDNNSADASCEAIKKAFPQVILIESKENNGFSKGNNIGFQKATGEYIFMLNPDTEFSEDAIRFLTNYLDQHAHVALVAPKLLNTDGSRQNSVWRYPTLWTLFCEANYLRFFLKKKEYADKDFTKPFEAESFSGAAILFRREVLDKIGNLNESMFWIEDVDFCYRANHAGLKCVYVPGTVITHHIGQSSKKNYNISISNQVVSKIKFFREYHAAGSVFIVKLISLYHAVLKLIVFSLLSPLNVVYWRKAKAYWFTLPRIINPPVGIY